MSRQSPFPRFPFSTDIQYLLYGVLRTKLPIALDARLVCLNELRSDLSYAAIVEEMISYKPNADKRDLTAIKRLCTAFMKLLFPHVQSRDDISQEDFENYCLRPAMEMRSVIKKQLCIIDPREFDVPGKRTIPEIVYKP